MGRGGGGSPPKQKNAQFFPIGGEDHALGPAMPKDLLYKDQHDLLCGDLNETSIEDLVRQRLSKLTTIVEDSKPAFMVGMATTTACDRHRSEDKRRELSGERRK